MVFDDVDKDSSETVFAGMSTIPVNSLSRLSAPSLSFRLRYAALSGSRIGLTPSAAPLNFSSCSIQHPPPQQAFCTIEVAVPACPRNLRASSESSETRTVEALRCLGWGFEYVRSCCSLNESSDKLSVGVVGVVSMLEASLSEYVPVVAVDIGDRPNCDVLIDTFLVRVGSSGMGL